MKISPIFKKVENFSKPFLFLIILPLIVIAPSDGNQEHLKKDVKQMTTYSNRNHSSSQNHSTIPDYVHAITDDESLVLAVASDLRTYLHLRGMNSTKLLDEIHDATFKLYSRAVVPTDNGGWLLQPGRWKDHPDYLYAGHSSIPRLAACKSPETKDPRCNLKPMPVDGIGLDVSHFLSKWPIFLIAYRDASYDNSVQQEFFKNLISGLEAQIFNHVIKPQKNSPPYLLTNYMDGTNGVYRWNYSRRGKNWGYDPFYLSSTPCYASIALLNSDRVSEFYRRIYHALPYTPSQIEVMGGELYSENCNTHEARLMISLSSKLSNNSKGKMLSISDTESQLFEKTFAHSLSSKESWIGENAYQGVVGQRQIVMHAAFLSGKEDWTHVFKSHFNLFIKNIDSKGWQETSEFNKWHQLLFASRYLVLSAQHNIDSEFHEEIYKYLSKKVARIWKDKNNPPISDFGAGEPIFVNYHDWIKWQINLRK